MFAPYPNFVRLISVLISLLKRLDTSEDHQNNDSCGNGFDVKAATDCQTDRGDGPQATRACGFFVLALYAAIGPAVPPPITSTSQST